MCSVHAGFCLLLWTMVAGTSLAHPDSCWPLDSNACDTPVWQSQVVLGSLGAQPLLPVGQI